MKNLIFVHPLPHFIYIFSTCYIQNEKGDFDEVHFSQVARLQEQLQKERELRTALEAGLRISQRQLAVSSTIDEKVIILQKEID